MTSDRPPRDPSGFWAGRWFGFLFSPQGRISRGTYLYSQALFLGAMLAIMALEQLFSFVLHTFSLFGIVFVLLAWSQIAMATKRCHDLDRSFWWMLMVGLIPVVGTIWVSFMVWFAAGTQGANRYGPPPASL